MLYYDIIFVCYHFEVLIFHFSMPTRPNNIFLSKSCFANAGEFHNQNWMGIRREIQYHIATFHLQL